MKNNLPMNSKKYTFSRLFLLPLFLTINYLIFNGFLGFKEIFIQFCMYFTLNWFADKTIVEWSIKRGQRFRKEKEEREKKP